MTQDASYHQVSLQLLAAQLRQAIRVLSAQHESALQILDDRYQLHGSGSAAGHYAALLSDEAPRRPETPGLPDPPPSANAPHLRITSWVGGEALPEVPELTRQGTVTTAKGSQNLGRGTTVEAENELHRKHDLLDVWKKETRGKSMMQGQTDRAPARGSTRSLQIEEEEEEDDETNRVFESEGCIKRCVLRPDDPKRAAWDLGSLILVLYDMVMIPMGLFEPTETTFIKVMNWITRFYWTLDMPLSFLTGYVSKDGTIIDLRVSWIAKKYFRSWFPLDTIVVGVDWLELLAAAAAEGLGFARFAKVSRVFRILRMIRLLRLARMKEVLGLLTERLDSERIIILIDVLKLTVLMMASSHLIACCWFAIAKAEDSKKNWLHQHEYYDASMDFQYLMSLRWALSQFAGGMDEVTPHSIAENVYTIFVYLATFWAGAVFVSILTSSMTNWYIIGSQNAQQLTTLRRYLSQNGISRKLAVRVQRNAHHTLSQQQQTMPEADVTLLGQVSEPLRVELHFEMYAPMLRIHHFFAYYMKECPHVVRKICHSAMAISNTSTGDIIFNTGEAPERIKMYIVGNGQLEYSQITGVKATVERAHWVSEACLWVHWVHCGTLVCSEDSQIGLLDAKEFQSIVGQFQHIGFDPREYAIAFAENINRLEIATDLHVEFQWSDEPGGNGNSAVDEEPVSGLAKIVDDAPAHLPKKSDLFHADTKVQPCTEVDATGDSSLDVLQAPYIDKAKVTKDAIQRPPGSKRVWLEPVVDKPHAPLQVHSAATKNSGDEKALRGQELVDLAPGCVNVGEEQYWPEWPEESEV